MTVNIIQHATDETDWYDSDGTPNDLGIASLPLTLITLARAKRELRVPPGDYGQDTLIREGIKSAASFVQDDLNIPIVHEQVYTVLQQAQVNMPLTFRRDTGDIFVQYASKVRYEDANVDFYTEGDWPEVVAVNKDQDEMPDIAEQIAPGVREGDEIAGNIIIKAPEGGWPAAARNTYAVNYTRGVKDTYPPLDTIRQLVILKLRDSFYGTPMMKGAESNSAYERLAKIIRYYGVTHKIYRLA